MKKKMIFTSCLLLVGITVVLIVASGSLSDDSFLERQNNKTTDTWSFEFKEADEKLAFLSEYLTMPSDIIDAEYHIVYHDNSAGMIPGPSDWDIRVALKVKPENIPLWLDGFTAVSPEEIDLIWWSELASGSISWSNANAEYYKRDNGFSYLVIFPDENVILKAISTMSYVVSKINE